MKGTDIFPSKYLRAADLNGKEPVVTIDRVVMETLGDESKPVVYFQGKDKGMVTNKTNWNSLVELTGHDDSDEWNGCRVRLVSVSVEFQGKRVPSIRIERAKSAKPVMKKPEPPPVEDDFVTDDDSDLVPF